MQAWQKQSFTFLIGLILAEISSFRKIRPSSSNFMFCPLLFAHLPFTCKALSMMTEAPEA
jgi:hypothetical protein